MLTTQHGIRSPVGFASEADTPWQQAVSLFSASRDVTHSLHAALRKDLLKQSVCVVFQVRTFSLTRSQEVGRHAVSLTRHIAPGL